MLKINKDYKCPSEEQLEQEWIDWGNLLVDYYSNGYVILNLDENGNVKYEDITFPLELMTDKMIKDYA